MSGYGARTARSALSTFLQGADGLNAQLAIKRTEIGSPGDANVLDVRTFADYAHKPKAGGAFPLLSIFASGGDDESDPNSRIYSHSFALTLVVLHKMHGGNLDETFAAVDDYIDAMRDLFDRRDPSSYGSILGDDVAAGRVLEARLGAYVVRADPTINQPNVAVQWPRVTVTMIEDF